VCYQVRGVLNVDPEEGLAEIALAVHLRDGDIGVPVRDRSFAGVRLERNSLEAVRGRDYHEMIDPILVEVGIVKARTPGCQDSQNTRIVLELRR
jgi:hypothetical protein